MSLGFYIVVFGAFFYVLTCIAILDIALRDFGETYKKILWALAVMFPFFGVLLYFFYGRRKSRPRETPPKASQDGPPPD